MTKPLQYATVIAFEYRHYPNNALLVEMKIPPAIAGIILIAEHLNLIVCKVKKYRDVQ